PRKAGLQGDDPVNDEAIPTEVLGRRPTQGRTRIVEVADHDDRDRRGSPAIDDAMLVECKADRGQYVGRQVRPPCRGHSSLWAEHRVPFIELGDARLAVGAVELELARRR